MMHRTGTDLVVAVRALFAGSRFVFLDTDVQEGTACRLMHDLIDLHQQRY